MKSAWKKNNRMKNKIRDFIKDSETDIIKNENNYCVIVYSRGVLFHDLSIELIFKNIEDFKNKINKSIKKINLKSDIYSDFTGITFELFLYS